MNVQIAVGRIDDSYDFSSYCNHNKDSLMSNRKKYCLVLILIWALTLLPSLHYAYKQVEENRIVDHYLYSNKLIGLPINRTSAVRVSDQVRRDFNIQESSFVALNMVERPFLREDVGSLLTHKEGLCGEGTRVIVVLLNRLGFDATRITLFDKQLQGSHTLVSVVIDGQEFFIDSINSSSETNELLRNTDISANDFNLMHYSDNIAKRREFKRTDQSGRPDAYIEFLNNYWLYSYEAVPYSKLLTTIGFDMRVFNLNRPYHFVSIMAEEPNMVMFLITLMISVFIVYLLHKLGIIRKVLRMVVA